MCTGNPNIRSPFCFKGRCVPPYQIDHIARNGLIVCPYCGEEQEDTDFRIDGFMEGKVICNSCGNEFSFESEIAVYWSTKKIP